MPRWLSMLELLTVASLAPWFLVPGLGFRPWMMAVPLLYWGLRLLFSRQLTAPTPLAAPILGMSAMLGVSMLVSFDPARSLPKAAGLYYGIIVYFALVNTLSWTLTKRIVLPGVLLAGFAMAGLSLFGMRWTGTKLPWIGEPLAEMGKQLPRLLNNIPRAEKGISTNQLGGTLILLIPMQAAFFIHSLTILRGKVGDWARRLALGGGLCLSLFVLLLTQSRGAIAAAMVVLSLLLLFSLRRRRWLILLLIALSIVLGGALIFTALENGQFTEAAAEEITGSLALKSRPEIWARAYRMLQDHPYTGIGLDTFPKVLSARYPTFQIRPESSQTIPHAHNLYLQTALDLGLPGLMCFLALHMIVGWMLIQSWRNAHSPFMQTAAVGLFLGLVAQLLYGWVDCIALGQKPSIFFWVTLALSTILFKAVGHDLPDQDKP